MLRDTELTLKALNIISEYDMYTPIYAKYYFYFSLFFTWVFCDKSWYSILLYYVANDKMENIHFLYLWYWLTKDNLFDIIIIIFFNIWQLLTGQIR